MRFAFAALVALTATPALAEDLVFTLVNDSSHTITEMYVSPVGVDQWGENILFGAVEPGVSGDVTPRVSSSAGLRSGETASPVV